MVMCDDGVAVVKVRDADLLKMVPVDLVVDLPVDLVVELKMVPVDLLLNKYLWGALTQLASLAMVIGLQTHMNGIGCFGNIYYFLPAPVPCPLDSLIWRTLDRFKAL